MTRRDWGVWHCDRPWCRGGHLLPSFRCASPPPPLDHEQRRARRALIERCIAYDCPHCGIERPSTTEQHCPHCRQRTV